MLAVSGGLLFAGYQLIAYGWSQMRGQNAGFFDLLWPGRLTNGLPAADPPKAATTNTTGNAGGLTGNAGTLANSAGQPNNTGVGGSGLFGKGSLYGDTLGKIIP